MIPRHHFYGSFSQCIPRESGDDPLARIQL